MTDAPESIWVGDEVEYIRKDLYQEIALQCLSHESQACEAYEKQKAAEAERDRLVIGAFRAAAKAAQNVAKSYDVLKPNGKDYEPARVQRAAKSMVRIAVEDIESLTTEDARAAMREGKEPTDE